VIVVEFHRKTASKTNAPADPDAPMLVPDLADKGVALILGKGEVFNDRDDFFDIIDIEALCGIAEQKVLVRGRLEDRVVRSPEQHVRLRNVVTERNARTERMVFDREAVVVETKPQTGGEIPDAQVVLNEGGYFPAAAAAVEVDVQIRKHRKNERGFPSLAGPGISGPE
jgi:hypothetical protein